MFTVTAQGSLSVAQSTCRASGHGARRLVGLAAWRRRRRRHPQAASSKWFGVEFRGRRTLAGVVAVDPLRRLRQHSFADQDVLTERELKKCWKLDPLFFRRIH